MGYLDNTGLTYFWGKIKAAFGATLTVSGKTVTLKSKSGATLSTITTQDTTYSDATTSASGLMSSSDKTKLNGIATGATANTGTITGIKMNGASKGTSGVVDLGTVLTSHQDISGKANSSEAGYSLAVSGKSVSLKNKAGTVLSTITTQDTTYSAATTSANGLMSSGDKTKLDGVATGATKNSITSVTATLTVAGWSNKSQTVSVTGVTASNLVFVTVNDMANGIKCTAQGSGTLTFTCETVPTASVTVSVAVLS